MTVDLQLRKASERERVASLLSGVEAPLRRAFSAFLKDATSEASVGQVRRALEQGNIGAALDVVDRHVVALGTVLPRVFAAAGTVEARALEARFRNTAARVALHFDPTNVRAAEIAQNNRLRFVTDFSREQRVVTQNAIANALRRGDTLGQAAGNFVNSIGLTRTQYAAVDSYRAVLNRQSSQALSRALRDRRFDATIERSLESGEPLSGSQVDRMVARYHDRMLAMRAETIARTEGLAALNQARHEATEQMIETAGFDPADVRRVWRATQDGRTRDHHAAMDGQMVGLDEPFVSGLGTELMFPGDPTAPAEERIHCRCSVTIEFVTDQAAAA